MTIAAVLQSKGGDVTSVDAGQTVTAVLALLADQKIGAVPVLRDGAVEGIFSERDVLYGLHAEGAAFLDRAVGEVMTAPALTAAPEMTALSALSLMTRRRIRHLPIISGDRLIGFVSIGDLVKYRIGRIEAEADAMRSYITGA